MKLVFIGAGSGFGAKSFVDLMSFPELGESEVVLVDINPNHLDPVEQYCRKVVEAHNAPTRITPAAGWRDGALEGADYVMTSFAQGGPAYRGFPFAHEIEIPMSYGIRQNVADTVGIGGVFRTMRTAPEMMAIAETMAVTCPDAYLLNYVNPMSMLTRILSVDTPQITTLGLCHNIQYTIRDIEQWIGASHGDLVYEAAGINHMAWFLKLEYLDGRNVYPDLLKAAEDPEIYKKRPVQFELLKAFGAFTTESSRHCSEYIPYFLPREADRLAMGLDDRHVDHTVPAASDRWNEESSMVRQTAGLEPLTLERSFEYGMHIVHASETDAVYRMNLNVMNDSLIDNLPQEACVEVTCTVDRSGIHPYHVGNLPTQLAALNHGMADMQILAADAVLEKDLTKAFMACAIDPTTAASVNLGDIRRCFNELAEAERAWLEPYWGKTLRV